MEQLALPIGIEFSFFTSLCFWKVIDPICDVWQSSTPEEESDEEEGGGICVVNITCYENLVHAGGNYHMKSVHSISIVMPDQTVSYLRLQK